MINKNTLYKKVNMGYYEQNHMPGKNHVCYSFDSCIIRKMIEDPNYLNYIRNRCDFSNSTVLLSETAKFEITKQLDKFSPGSTFTEIVDTIKKSLKCDVEEMENSQQVEEIADMLLSLYCSEGLHYPDNLHMAFSDVHKTIFLTRDNKLATVCKMHKIICINTNNLATNSGEFVKPTLHKIEQVIKFKPKIQSRILKPGQKIIWRSYA